CFAFAVSAAFGRIGMDVVVFSQAGAALFTLGMLCRQLVRYGLTPPSRAQAPAALAPEQPPA
ncbi:MAG TPA: hypothetical protein VL172_10105, partial [Kofleriaceae bacterium]|nr:hypothetical protein [Kofleriaceae bacterium]